MPSQKYSGKILVLLYATAVNTAPTIDLSGSSRQTQINQQGSDIDVSTRDDMVLNSTAYLAGPPARDLQHSGLDTTPKVSRTWRTIEVGDEGRVAIYPLGSSPSGLPYEIGNVIATGSSYDSPHDNAAKWDLKWRVSGTWTQGTT